MRRARIPAVAEMTVPPEVGRTYRVPTVLSIWHGGRESRWPVIGPRHEDAEHLKFGRFHYHIDLRFVTTRQALRMRRAYSYRFPDEERQLIFAAAQAPVMGVDGKLAEPVERVLTCTRQASAYPFDVALKSPQFKSLYAAYAGRRCGRDANGVLICPHKGAPLGSLVPDAEGRVTCPLHGLVIDVDAGAVVGAHHHEGRAV